MKYILDSSAALQVVLPEADSIKAMDLLEGYRTGIHELFAPDILPVETLHGLTKAERRNRIPVASGFALWQVIMVDAPHFHPHIPLLPRAYEIASGARIGIYDCVYVALAEREQCELVTSDARLLTNLQKQFPFIIPLSSLP